MAGLAAVDGVKDQGAVRLLAHGGAGIAPGGQVGDHSSVFRQTVERADGILYILPAIVGGDGEGQFTSLWDVLQCGGIVAVRLQIGGENDLIRRKAGDGGLFHPIHPEGDSGADGQLPLLHGADYIDAGFCGAGGVLGVKIVCIEVKAAVGASLVHRRHRPDQLCGVSEAVIHGITQICGDLDAGFAQNGRAVRPEADGVISGVTAAEQSLRNHYANGQAGGDIVEIAVDAGHYPVAVIFQQRGRVRHAGTVCQRVAVGDNGGHSLVRRVGDEIFRPEIGVSCTPEYIGGKLCLLVEKCVLGGQVLPQRV